MNSVRIPIPPLQAEETIGRPLTDGSIPRYIVVLRFHAFGDAVITLPVLMALRDRFPNSRIEFVTSEEYAPLFTPISSIDRVHTVDPFGTWGSRLRSARRLIPTLGSPDLVLDLQRSILSRLITRMLRPKAWAALDRFAPKHAIERYLDTVRKAGIANVSPSFIVPLEDSIDRSIESHFAPDLLRTDSGPLVCLNPAGCWETKNWPPERYAELGARMIREWNARILLLGTENVRPGAEIIERELGEMVVNLVGRTTPLEALALVRRLSLMVSDDSGLMHLAWTCGVPTLGIFGASRGVWSRPWGEHTRFLGSEDLPCGACMRPNCFRGDRICLTRVSVEQAFAECAELLGGGRGIGEGAKGRNGEL